MAFERLLCAWNEARILCDDQDLFVVDKPSGMPVHGGDAVLVNDVVRRLEHHLRALGRDTYLGVHQRLDQGTSGVLAFTRRGELNPVWAKASEAHELGRIYVAAVMRQSRCRLAAGGRLEHRLEPKPGERTRIVNRGGQLALTEYRVLAERGARALLELRPKTGRTHQLRAQLAHSGAPIAGDRLYGGSSAPRLLLHCRELAVPALERRFRAEVPRELEQWLESREPELGDAADVERRVQDAGCLRFSLAERATAVRLVNGAGDLLPGVVVDRYGDYATLALASDEALARRDELATLLLRLGARGVYLKCRARRDLRRAPVSELAPPEPLAGERAPAELEVREDDLRCLVSLEDGLSTGLFVDQRENRARVRALAAGRRVLNLFSYTCSFSVAAALGGAASTLSVDLSGRALARGRKNFELNGITGEHRFLKEDALVWLERAARRGERFDLIVLDPPSFATIGKGTFTVARGYGELARRALAVLAPGGVLLAVTNHRKTSQADLRHSLQRAAAATGLPAVSVRDVPSPLECPESEDGPEPSKSVLLQNEP